MQKLQLWLIVYFLIFSITYINSQNTIKKNYEKEAIYLRMGFWGQKYIKNGKSYPIRIFNDKLDNEMKISRTAYKEYKKYKINKKIILAGNLIGLGLAVYGEYNAIKLLSKNQWDEKLFNKFTNFTLIGMGTIMITIPFQYFAYNRLQKAIWLRNRDILNHIPSSHRRIK